MRVIGLTGAALAGALLLAACGSNAAEPTGTPATWNDVISLTYVSTAVTEDGAAKPLASETPISIAFTDASLSAQAGCNTLAGPAAITDGVLEVGELASTRMACDQALMEQDQWLSTFLTSKPHATYEQGVLTLTGDNTTIDLAVKETVGFADSPAGGPEAKAQVIALCEELLTAQATETDAQQAAEQHGFMFRVVSREGEDFPVTMDYRPDRLNVKIEGGVVTECTAG